MTTDNASPTPHDDGIEAWSGAPDTRPGRKATSRRPSGAAVAGAHPRPTFYPRQIVIMATDAQADYIAELAKARNVSKSEVGRMLLDAGIAAGSRDE